MTARFGKIGVLVHHTELKIKFVISTVLTASLRLVFLLKGQAHCNKNTFSALQS